VKIIGALVFVAGGITATYVAFVLCLYAANKTVPKRPHCRRKVPEGLALAQVYQTILG
jgi:hypothetical protein